MRKLPNHVAIIMDGNTRWAENNNLNKNDGHKEGVKKARLAVEFFLENKIKNLTLFAFSTENWGREKKEVKALLKLFLEAINEQTPDLIKNKVKLNFIGEISRFDKALINKIKSSQTKTSKYVSKMSLNIAISYGGRWDIEQALKSIVKDILKRKIKVKNIDESLIANYLSTSLIPDPDLILGLPESKELVTFIFGRPRTLKFIFQKNFGLILTRETLKRL